MFPGSYDPAARVKEIIEDETDAEVIFNGVADGVERHQAVPGQGAQPGLLQGLQRLDRRVPGLRARSGSSATPRLPTTGIDDCLDELQRFAEHGSAHGPARVLPERVLLRARRPRTTGSGPPRSRSDMPINVHTQFFFPAGDLGSKIDAEGVPQQRERAKKLGLDVEAGSFPVDPGQDDHLGVFERFPDLSSSAPRSTPAGCPTTWSVSTSRSSATGATGSCRCCRVSTSGATCRVVYIVDEIGAANRYDIGVGNIMWGPDFPHSSSNWPVDYQLGREILERAGATPSEIERIMWRNAADIYKIPYDEPASVGAAA